MKAIVANRLTDGEVVYWNQGAWKARFGEAELFNNDNEAEAALADANKPLVVVDCYLIDVADEGEGPVPTAFRERVKATGPQNHPQHGKQAEGGADIDAIRHAQGVGRSAGRHGLIKLKK
jgi:sulfite reductase (NADPH) hemoprotein beta-component